MLTVKTVSGKDDIDEKVKGDNMKFMNIVRNNFYLYKLANKFCRKFLWLTILVNILRGVVNTVAMAVFVKIVYDCLVNYPNINRLLVIVAAMAVIFLVYHVINGCYDIYFAPLMKYKLYHNMYEVLLNKAAKVDIEYYDNPEYYNDFIWSMNEADSRIYNAITLLGNIINSLIYAAGMISITLTIDVVVAVVILSCIAIGAVLNVWRVKVNYQRDTQLNPLNRQMSYYDRVIYLPEYAKEIKTTDVSDLLLEKFDNTMENINHWTYKYAKRTAFINFLMRFSTASLFDVGLVMFLAYKVMVTGTLAISDFAVLVNIIWQIFFAFNNLINNISTFYENGVYSQKLRKFLALETKIKEAPVCKPFPQEIHSLRIDNLSFAYTDRDILKNINLHIKAGEKIAIVGYNGSGKTTLVKQILRLYDACKGSIQLNDVNIREYPLQEYRNSFGVIFQDYQLFALSLNDNIIMGNGAEKNDVRMALKKSGLLVNGDEFTLDAQITKEFDNNGLLLSGGQSQRVALARLFYKDCNIQILDEPSSSLDPKIEEELNNSIISENKNKTVIFISHRLSTVRLADKIIFLNKGAVEEVGSHDELMKLNGKYAEMFRIQASKYLFE